MQRPRSSVRKSLLTVLLVIASIVPPAMAQTPEETKAPNTSEVAPLHIAKHLLSEQSHIWSSPLRVKRTDAKWLLPIAGGTAALLAVDRNVADAARNAEGLRPPSRFLSRFGGIGPLGIASGGFYGIGKLARNDKTAGTGVMAFEAVLNAQLTAQGMKIMFNRERPNKVGGHGDFWDGGRSFPSGHAATSFAFATVVADRYKNNKLTVIGVYGLATAVSMSRIGGLNHHPSDVLIGATIGHLIGRYVLHSHVSK